MRDRLSGMLRHVIWNLRLAAARRGIWKATDLRSMLAMNGLVISVGKMSALWSGDPVSIKLADLDIICRTLDCGVGELLVPHVRSAQHESRDDELVPQ